MPLLRLDLFTGESVQAADSPRELCRQAFGRRLTHPG
jgi:hypothetical protein